MTILYMKKQGAGSREQGAGSREQGAGSRKKIKFQLPTPVKEY
jgi:hypothetical protein